MNLLPIDANVPIPRRARRAVSQSARLGFPFASMLPGDSFLVPCDWRASQRWIARVRNSARDARVPYRLVARSVEGGVRIWREPEAL